MFVGSRYQIICKQMCEVRKQQGTTICFWKTLFSFVLIEASTANVRQVPPILVSVMMHTNVVEALSGARHCFQSRLPFPATLGAITLQPHYQPPIIPKLSGQIHVVIKS